MREPEVLATLRRKTALCNRGMDIFQNPAKRMKAKAKMDSDAWMPIYIGDYLRDTMHLNSEQHGCYLLLIFHAWTKGPIPDDDGILRSISRCPELNWARNKPILAEFFDTGNGTWVHKRVKEEKEAALDMIIRRQKQTEAATLSRWKKTVTDNVTDNVTHCLTEGPSPSPSPSVQEGGSPRAEDCQELPTLEESIAQTMTAGIPEDFSRHVYEDWSSRSGKDAGGVLVRFLPYVTKRWAREQVEWRSGQHKGKKASLKPSGARLGPSLKEVQTYASDKWGEDDRHHTWAVSFHRFWADKGWKRQGRLIDWESELTKQVAGWRVGT